VYVTRGGLGDLAFLGVHEFLMGLLGIVVDTISFSTKKYKFSDRIAPGDVPYILQKIMEYMIVQSGITPSANEQSTLANAIWATLSPPSQAEWERGRKGDIGWRVSGDSINNCETLIVKMIADLKTKGAAAAAAAANQSTNQGMLGFPGDINPLYLAIGGIGLLLFLAGTKKASQQPQMVMAY
jgi:hypothetical protein